MCGLTNGTTGQAASNHGSNDVFIVRTDSLGNYLWSQCYGGTGSDIGYSIALTPDGFPVFTGMTESNDGDVSGNHGGKDLWLVKLNESPISTNEISKDEIDFKYSINEGQISISFVSKKNEESIIHIYNLLGQEILNEKLMCIKGKNTFTLDIKNTFGVNIIQLQNGNTSLGYKILVRAD